MLINEMNQYPFPLFITIPNCLFFLQDLATPNHSHVLHNTRSLPTHFSFTIISFKHPTQSCSILQDFLFPFIEGNVAPWGRGRSLHVDKARRLYYQHLTEIARGDASHITHLADCVHTIASCPHMFLFVQQQQTIVITLSYQWSYLSSYRRPNLSFTASSAFVGFC